MPGAGLNLNLNNLQRKNYNSIALQVWDFNKIASTITGFIVETTGGSIMVQWGDNTQNTSTTQSTTLNKTYT